MGCRAVRPYEPRGSWSFVHRQERAEPTHESSDSSGKYEHLAPIVHEIEVVFRHLASIMRAAVRDQLQHVSPCDGVKLPRRTKELIEPLTVEQVHALGAAAPARYRALVTLAAGTGLRQGECFGLTVDRVDFLRRSLRVDRQLILATGDPVLADPKAPSSVRTCPCRASSRRSRRTWLSTAPGQMVSSSPTTRAGRSAATGGRRSGAGRSARPAFSVGPASMICGTSTRRC